MDWIDQARKQREIDAIPEYGKMVPKENHRDFIKEGIGELLDALNYFEWSYIREDKKKKDLDAAKWFTVQFQIKKILTWLKEK